MRETTPRTILQNDWQNFRCQSSALLGAVRRCGSCDGCAVESVIAIEIFQQRQTVRSFFNRDIARSLSALRSMSERDRMRCAQYGARVVH